MYTKDENGSRQHQFISEDMSKVDLQGETPLQEINKSTIGVEEIGSRCSIEERGYGGLGSIGE
jgi:hypothetical protein